jgi:hypothetical protein
MKRKWKSYHFQDELFEQRIRTNDNTCSPAFNLTLSKRLETRSNHFLVLCVVLLAKFLAASLGFG